MSQYSQSVIEAVKVKARKDVLLCSLRLRFWPLCKTKATDLLKFFPAVMWGPVYYLTLTLLSSSMMCKNA